MSHPVITVTPDTNTNAAVELLIDHEISALPVVGSNGELVGIVSEADLLPFETRADPGSESTVASVMTSRVLSVPDSCEVARVARILLEADYRRVPVVKHGKVVGIVSRRDLVKVIARRDDMIKTQVTARLEKLGLGFSDGDIGVEVGVVTVHLDDYGAKRRHAESVARSVRGVMDVRFR